MFIKKSCHFETRSKCLECLQQFGFFNEAWNCSQVGSRKRLQAGLCPRSERSCGRYWRKRWKATDKGIRLPWGRVKIGENHWTSFCFVFFSSIFSGHLCLIAHLSSKFWGVLRQGLMRTLNAVDVEGIQKTTKRATSRRQFDLPISKYERAPGYSSQVVILWEEHALHVAAWVLGIHENDFFRLITSHFSTFHFDGGLVHRTPFESCKEVFRISEALWRLAFDEGWREHGNCRWSEGGALWRLADILLDAARLRPMRCPRHDMCTQSKECKTNRFSMENLDFRRPFGCHLAEDPVHQFYFSWYWSQDVRVQRSWVEKLSNGLQPNILGCITCRCLENSQMVWNEPGLKTPIDKPIARWNLGRWKMRGSSTIKGQNGKLPADQMDGGSKTNPLVFRKGIGTSTSTSVYFWNPAWINKNIFWNIPFWRGCCFWRKLFCDEEVSPTSRWVITRRRLFDGPRHNLTFPKSSLYNIFLHTWFC